MKNVKQLPLPILKADIKKILEIPMPSSSKFNIPIWHTIGFMFGFNFLMKFFNSVFYIF